MPEKKDLLVLTADKDANLGIGALLNRQVDLGIRSITFGCRSHPKHDSGVLIGAHDFLRPFLRYFEYALVVFDLEGCGREGLGRAGVERKIHENLTANGWQGRCEVVAINPELESWVWDETLRVAPALGWDKQRLADWLRREEFLAGTTVKPVRPKEAFREAMRAAKRQMSSSVFPDLAKSANVTGCTDAAFRKFLLTIQLWFSPLRQQ